MTETRVVSALKKNVPKSHDSEAIPPKRTYRRARYFSRGEFARLCLDALRKADGPLTTAVIVAGVKAKSLPA